MRRLDRCLLGLLLLACCACATARAADPAYPFPRYSVVPIFFVPTDWPIDSSEVQQEATALRTAVEEIQRFYAQKLGGNTFQLNELVVLQAAGPKEAYGIHWNGGNIYTDGINLDGSLEALVVAELHNRGYPTPPAQNEDGYVALIFLKGAGGYAGGRELGSGDGGWAVLGDWAIDSIQGQVPEGAYWWSGRRLQVGAAAHELGHTFGLPHPDAWGGDFAGKLMGAWWDYPNLGFADWENDQLNRNKVQFFTQCQPPNAIASAPAVKPYELVLLPTLGADARALHINDLGVISGYAEATPTHPHLVLFAAEDNTLIDLGTGGGAHAAATSINNKGIVSGYWDSISGVRRATRSHFDRHLNRWITEELPALHPDDAPVANAINDAGLIAGATLPQGGEAVLWKGSKALGSGFGLPSVANALNKSGQIVGRVTTAQGARGFAWRDNGNGVGDAGEWIDLGVTTTIASAASEALDVNERGQIVGSVDDGGLGRRYAFRITPAAGQPFVDGGNGKNALMTMLPRLGRGDDAVLSINQAGVAVGRSQTCSSGPHAALWSEDRIVDLNDVIAGDSGVTLLSAQSINQSGAIVGAAQTTDGVRGFLLRPLTPAAPNAVRARAEGHRVVLTWTDLSSNETGFELQRRESGVGADWSLLVAVGAGLEKYEDATALPKIAYEYRIRAVNAYGASEYAAWPPVQTGSNRSPAANGDRYVVTKNSILIADAKQGVLANDSDPEADALSVVAIKAAPKQGTLQWSADGAFRYTPKQNYTGSDRFDYVVRDALGGEATGVVTIKVNK